MLIEDENSQLSSRPMVEMGVGDGPHGVGIGSCSHRFDVYVKGADGRHIYLIPELKALGFEPSRG
jgi:hypothetical protein